MKYDSKIFLEMSKQIFKNLASSYEFNSEIFH
jgi:hypothetical protein